MKACQRNKPCSTFPRNSKGQCTADTCAYYTKRAAFVDVLDEIKVGSPYRGNTGAELYEPEPIAATIYSPEKVKVYINGTELEIGTYYLADTLTTMNSKL